MRITLAAGPIAGVSANFGREAHVVLEIVDAAPQPDHTAGIAVLRRALDIASAKLGAGEVMAAEAALAALGGKGR